MRLKNTLLICVVLSASGCLADDAKISPRLTADVLIEYYMGQPGVPASEQDANSLYKKQFAKGYLAGAADGSQGKAWCDKGKVKTGEIDSYVIGELRELPLGSLRRDAADLVIELLKKKFPCHDIVSPALGGIRVCGSNCYWTSSEVWFWALA